MKYIEEITIDGTTGKFEVETDTGYVLVNADNRAQAANGARNAGHRVLSIHRIETESK